MDNHEQNAKLSILPVNKTVVVYSPIEGKNVLVRTGTIGDGSCCYHAMLHAYSKEYVGMNEKERCKFVTKLRSSLASKVDRTRWEEISGGLVAKIPFQENVNSLLHDFYKHISNGKDGRNKNIRKVIRRVIRNDKDRDTFSLITDMVKLEDFERTILPDVYDKCAEDSISTCREKLVSESERFYGKVFSNLNEKVDSRRIDFCIKKLGELVLEIAEEAETMAFTDYISNLKNVSVVVDRYTIGLISNRFNRDIYFLDSRTRMPYREGGTDHLKGRKSIIIMWTGGVHYEVVGKLLPGNRIQREFKPDDPLIKRINTYLCHPERIADEYPNLIPYLPKEHRDRIGLTSKNRPRKYSDSRSDYDNSSDDSYQPSSQDESERNSSKSPSILFKSPSPSRKSRDRHTRHSLHRSPERGYKYGNPSRKHKRDRRHGRY